MNRIKTIPVILFLVCFNAALNGQTPDRVIDSLLNVLKTAKKDTVKINTLNSLSTRFRQISNYPDARKYADSALALAEKLNFRKGIAYAYNIIGGIYYDQGNYPAALKNHMASLKIFEEIGNKQRIAYSYIKIGNIYYSQGNYPEALRNYLASLKINKEIGDKRGIAASYGSIGIIYDEQGNYPEALKNKLAALKIDEEIGNKEGIAIDYGNIGIVYFNQGNYPEALKNYLASLKIKEEIGDKQGVAHSYINIGNIYSSMGNCPEALKNYLASLKIWEEIGNKWGIALSYNNIGIVYSDQGNYSDALKNHLASLKIKEEIGDKQGIAMSYHNIGNIYTSHGNYPEALKNHLASLKICEEVGDKGGIVSSSISIGTLNIKLSKPVEAKKWLDKSLSLSKETGNKEQIKDTYGKLSSLDSAMGNYSLALVHYKLYTDFKDSLLNEANNKQIAQMKELYESEKKDKEIVQLESEKQMLESEKQMLESEKQITALLIKTKDDSLRLVQSEKEKIRLENEKAQALNLYNQQQMALLAKEKQLQQLQIEKNKAASRKRNELLLIGAGMLLFVLIFVFHYMRQRTLKQRAIERADAVHKMAELELQSLRAQLNPHFMFNSLNAIQELILMEDNERSHIYLSRFSKLIRMLLDNASQPFIPLRKEIEFLELYLSLEKLRIPDLQYKIEIDPGIDTNSATIPNMILQPYIENAIWHGLSPKTSDKKLLLHIYSQNGNVQYEIEDNGIGRQKATELKSLYRKEHKSKGMELLTKRFKLLNEEFGSEIKTAITDLAQNGHAGGTRVSIFVPGVLSGSANGVVI